MNNVPVLVRFVKQSGHHPDCAVGMLAMFSGVMYEDALLACYTVNKHVLKEGMSWAQIKRAAKRLGIKTRILHKYDAEESTGILHVSRVALGLGQPSEHVVLLWEGRIVDGDGELWLSLGDYLRHYGYEAKALLVALEEE